MTAPRRTLGFGPIRIASLGNDTHYWRTLLAAFGNLDRYEVRIGSSRIDRRLLKGVRNVTAISPKIADDVRALYAWADLVVVSLKPNLHASGITVVFESVISGSPRYVMRTFEGPACGAFMLHERTESHLEVFREGKEAAFFESSDELIDKVRYYLSHESERERIRQAGQARTLSGSNSYRDRLEEILQAALA